jgi:hypothetical protein
MYKGTILQYLRKYIKNLQSDQLESYILAGECTLHAIELEPSAIEDWIGEIVPHTVEIERVFCSKVEIKIPWAQIKSKPLLVNIHEMEITAYVHDARDQEWNKHMAATQLNKLIDARISDISSYDSSKVHLKQFELGWMDYVFSGAQIRIEFCKMILKTRSVSRTPPPVGHACSPEIPFSELPDKVTAFTVHLEGLLVAPCHSAGSGEWNLTYVDTPEMVYQFDIEKKFLQLSRLVTLRKFCVYIHDSDRILIDHSPGFRMRIVSDYHCLSMHKNKTDPQKAHRFAISPFPAKTSSAVWFDNVNVSGGCGCDIASFWSILQDLLAPVIVPAESLLPENRAVHYTFGESGILAKSSEEELEKFKVPDEFDIGTSNPNSPRSKLPELPELKISKKKRKSKISSRRTDSDASPTSTNIVGETSDPSIEIKRLLYGLAKEVRTNAFKVTEQTDKFVSKGKKIFSSMTRKSRSKRSIDFGSGSPDGLSSLSPTSNTDAHDGDVSPAIADNSSGRMTDDGFLDAVSDEDEDGEAFIEDSDRRETFGSWTDPSLIAEEYECSQLAVMDKICHKSFFHLHVNELVLHVGKTLELKFRNFDLSTDSMTPATFAQLKILASFSTSSGIFLSQAKKLCENVLCPLEPVHAATAVTVSHFTANTLHGDAPMELVLKLGPTQTSNITKGLCLKWKSRTHPPTRLINGSAVETGRIQPMEGCIHRAFANVPSLTPLSDLYAQLMAWCGDFPDPSFDPEIRMRIFVRDLTVAAAAARGGPWRFHVPSTVVTKSLRHMKYLDLLSGFQTLSEIPECHFEKTDVVATVEPTGFPIDGSFCSCICGQEKTSWSWVLPTIDQVPRRVLFPGKVLSTAGTVVERVWKDMELQNDHVHVPMSEYTSLIETKLKIAEQEFQIQQMNEQYEQAMEELTRRNVLLKEKWVAEAIQLGSKQTVVDILSEKVCVMEKLVKELTDSNEMSVQQLAAVRGVCAVELADSRRKMLEESQRLHLKLSDCDTLQNALSDELKLRDREIDSLKHQREFLLGLGPTRDSSVIPPSIVMGFNQ